MDRQQFIVFTAAALFAAFLLGWFASWLIHRLTRSSRADLHELDRMARQLHEAEAREVELQDRLQTAESEMRTAMDGLRESRTEVEELRDYIEKRFARTRTTGGATPGN